MACDVGGCPYLRTCPDADNPRDCATFRAVRLRNMRTVSDMREPAKLCVLKESSKDARPLSKQPKTDRKQNRPVIMDGVKRFASSKEAAVEVAGDVGFSHNIHQAIYRSQRALGHTWRYE